MAETSALFVKGTAEEADTHFCRPLEILVSPQRRASDTLMTDAEAFCPLFAQGKPSARRRGYNLSMKIVQLDIQGFRSLKNVSWRPGDLNVVIGPNGSGKSNLLRMLEMISAAAQGRLSRYVQSAGGMGAIVWDGQLQDIRFGLAVSGTGVGLAPKGFSYELVLEALPFSADYVIESETLTATNDNFVILRSDGTDATIRGREESKQLEASGFEKESVLSSLNTPLISWIKLSALPFYQQKLVAWTLYQDIRTDQNAPIRQAPVSRLEQRVAPDGQNLINVLHTLYTSDRQFKQDINDAMFAAFGNDFDELVFPPDAGDQRVQMRVRWKTLKRDQSTADLSDGTLRFLFLITVLASPNPPPLIAIDEPETGLHPSMLPIIAEFAVEASRRTQVIFTTHSDQFLDAFRGTKPTTTVAKWENGETILKTIEGEALDYWLEEYSLGSLFRSGELEDME